jgi:hypothetical protein
MADIEYRFGTGQGDPHVHHSPATVDVNGDGTADGVALDFDGDGRVDDVMWDSDGDGVADTALLDLDDDGKAESAYHDPTDQGTWNAHGRGGTDHATEPTDPAPHPTGEQSGGYAPYDDPAGGAPDGHSGDDGGDDGDGLFDDLLDDHDGADSADPAGAEWFDDLDR